MSIMARFWFTMMTLGIVINYLETAYYGWNWKPASPAEHLWDIRSATLVMFGFFGLLICRWLR